MERTLWSSNECTTDMLYVVAPNFTPDLIASIVASNFTVDLQKHMCGLASLDHNFYNFVFMLQVNSNDSSNELTTTLTSPSGSVTEQMKANFFNSLKIRGFDTICLLNANDADIFDFIQNFPHGATGINGLILRCCNITDRGLEAIMEFLQGLFKLEIAGCNEITEQGLWSSLHPRLASLTINDCINVADECVCAVTQLLPALYEFNLQVSNALNNEL